MTTDGPPLSLIHHWFVRTRAAHADMARDDAEIQANLGVRQRLTAQTQVYGQMLRALARHLYPHDYDGHDWGDEIPF